MFVCVIIKKEDNAYIYSWNFTTNTYKKNDKVNQSLLDEVNVTRYVLKPLLFNFNFTSKNHR